MTTAGVDITAAMVNPMDPNFDPDNLDQYAEGASAEDLYSPPEASGEEGADDSEQSEPSATDGAAVAATPEVSQATTATPAPAPAPAPSQPELVLTRDGKHAIPYSVLEAERAARRAAEQQLAQLAAERTQAQPNQPQQPLTVEQQAFAAMQQRLAILEQERAVSLESQVQAAIDANPKLAFAQSLPDQSVFNALVELDSVLREKPAYAGVPMAQRFAKVVAMYEAAEGPIQLPGAVATPAPAVSDAEVQKAAAAAVDKATARAAAPNTLSDIAGSAVPPRSGTLGQFKDMSAAQLTHSFMNLTPEEIDRQLARI